MELDYKKILGVCFKNSKWKDYKWQDLLVRTSQPSLPTGGGFIGGGNPIVPTLGNYNVVVRNTVPVQAQAFNTGGSGSVDLSGVYAALAEISKKVDDTQSFVLSI